MAFFVITYFYQTGTDYVKHDRNLQISFDKAKIGIILSWLFKWPKQIENVTAVSCLTIYCETLVR
jgi:hypothetical protein